MRKSFTMRFLVVALWSGAAWAQGRIQNFDIFISAGPAWNKSHAIGGTNVTLADSWGLNSQTDYGYQIARASAASLWIDYSMVFPDAGLKANVPISHSGRSGFAATLGLRFMVPVNSRLSFYTVSGGGGGSFWYPAVSGADNPSVFTNSTIHGVFSFGGGADVRLVRWFSLRVEVRDLVTGKELDGAAGRHHVVPLFGVAFHF